MEVFERESLFSNPSCVEVGGKGMLSKGQEIKDIPGRRRERPKARLRTYAPGEQRIHKQLVLCLLRLKAQGTWRKKEREERKSSRPVVSDSL